MPEITPQDIINDAADNIEPCLWTQGTYGPDQDGKLCLVGMLAKAAGAELGSDERYFPENIPGENEDAFRAAIDIVADYIGLGQSDSVRRDFLVDVWNDDPEREFQDVRNVLLAAQIKVAA